MHATNTPQGDRSVHMTKDPIDISRIPGGLVVDIETGTILNISALRFVRNMAGYDDRDLDDHDVILYAERHGQPLYILDDSPGQKNQEVQTGTWTVRWEIDLDLNDAEDPRGAALECWTDIFNRNPRPNDDDACVFTVTAPDGTISIVDLADESGDSREADQPAQEE